jgi:hypothetical protein
VSGALIRSDVIAGYPGLLIDAYDSHDKEATALPSQRFSKNILLCLYSGEIARLDSHSRQNRSILH